MKRIIFSLVLVFVSLISFSQKKEIDVYLIGGQSNATGQGYMVNLPSNFKIDRSVQFFYSKKLGGGEQALTWGPLCQASETSDKFGVELSMGTTLKQHNPNKEIAIIKHALSGSNLFQQWNPGKNRKDNDNFGPEFKKFISTIAKGLDELKAKGYKPRIKAMVWQQGEGDALAKAGIANSEKYGENLQHFIKRVRNQLKIKKMPFIYGYVIPVPLERFTGRDQVQKGQYNVSQNSGSKLSLKGAFLIETNDLPLRCDEPNSPYPNDKVHFNTFGILELGNRFAQKIDEALNE